MSKFIEEFYYGNIDSQARSTKQNKTVQKQMDVLMLNEKFLTEALMGKNKKNFLNFVNAWSIVNGESNLDSFIMGFRLGANFTYDTFYYSISATNPQFIFNYYFCIPDNSEYKFSKKVNGNK